MSQKNHAGFRCDCSAATVPLEHPWEHTVGSGHATLALRADWQRQLTRCHAEIGVRRVRFHGLLSDDMGTLVCEKNKLIDSFLNIDRIFDFLLSIGMQPYVELSFMPTALASGKKTVFHYGANVTPPLRLKAWAALIRRLGRHLVDRYGIGEVSEWYFEVWNEPNLAAFWTGTQKEYFAMYRATALALKSVDASLRVGGPATAQTAWIPQFMDYCARHHAPIDFVSTHYYPTDALGGASTDTTTELAQAPHDVMRDRAVAVREHADGRPLIFSEWNTTSNPRDHLHDESFGAAFASRIALSVADVVQGYSYWTFSDIFEENYLPSAPFHGGFGLLSLHDVAKPVYRAFEILHKLGHEKLTVSGSHRTVSTWVTREHDRLTALAINCAMPRHPIRTESLRIELTSAAPPRAAFIERIDADHTNPCGQWEAIGRPSYPSVDELAAISRASNLVREKHPITYDRGTIYAECDLLPQSVTALTIDSA